MAGIQADAPLGEAAGAIAQLQTATACRKAQSDVVAAVTAAIESMRKYGDNLNAAARAYTGRDQDGADAINGVDIPR